MLETITLVVKQDLPALGKQLLLTVAGERNKKEHKSRQPFPAKRSFCPRTCMELPQLHNLVYSRKQRGSNLPRSKEAKCKTHGGHIFSRSWFHFTSITLYYLPRSHPSILSRLMSSYVVCGMATGKQMWSYFHNHSLPVALCPGLLQHRLAATLSGLTPLVM